MIPKHFFLYFIRTFLNESNEEFNYEFANDKSES